MAGGRIDIEVGADVSRFPAELEKGTRSAIGVATKVGGLIGAALGVSASAQAVLDLGNSFTNSVNEMQAVSQGTVEQMNAVREAAKGLGNDASIADTSATDAASAMTELAKGGFTVEQSMSAARGTLQLAAAAQIDAATAATIQSQALQAFGLDAEYAAKAADVLANGANASSAEITDVAAGLQQSGAVANQFGISLEDTVAGLGMLANAGIQGSDAGTLLKSALLALTDQGKPAQAAIRDLGLTVYDAEGKFVGFRTLFGELQTAANQMTPEMYQAASATLFGSDAMRLAGVAAEQGVAGWDQMRAAIEREGSAADVAAAKTQGLPGAIAGVQNAAEGLALELYDLVDGPLEGAAVQFGDFITNATPGLISGLTGVADTAMDVGSALAPVVDLVGDLVGVFMDLPGPVQAVVAGFAAIKGFDIDDKIGDTVGGWVDSASNGLQDFLAQMDEVRAQLAENMLEEADPEIDASTFEGSLDQVNSMLEENEEQISEVVAAWSTLEARSPAVAKMGDSYRNVTRRTGEFAQRQRDAATASGGLVGVLRNAGAGAATFGGQVGGVAVAGLSGLKSAAGGVISAFGGPWMVGLAAAGMAVSAIVGEIQTADRHHELLAERVEQSAIAHRKLTTAMMESHGALDDNFMSLAVENISRIRTETEELGDTGPGIFSKLYGGLQIVGQWAIGTGDSFGRAVQQQMRMAEKSEEAAAAIDSLDLSNEELTESVYGSSGAWERLKLSLSEAGDGSAEAIRLLQEQRTKYENMQAVVGTTADHVLDFSAAIDVLSDSSSSADDRVSSLKTAIESLLGVPGDAQSAMAAYEQELADVSDAAVNAAAANGDLGDALLKDGKLDLTKQSARDLLEILDGMGTEFLRSAEAGNDVNAMYDRAIPTLETLATKWEIPIEKMMEFAAQAGLAPEIVSTLLEVRGADDVRTAISSALVALQNYSGEGDATAELFVEDEQARQALEEAGLKVELLDEATGKIRITAENSMAMEGLRQVDELLNELNLKDVGPDVTLDDVAFQLKNEEVIAQLGEIDLTEVAPNVAAVITDFLEGRDVTLAELAKIGDEDAEPEVLLKIQDALDNARVVSDAIDEAARNRTVRITVDDQWDPSRRTQYFGTPTVQGPMPVREAGGRLPEYNSGGRMPSTGPGTETTDGIYAVTPDGTAIAKVDGSEWVINSRSSDKYDRELSMINAGVFPKLPGFETGGRLDEGIATRRAAQFLSGEDGKPYQYSGVGTPSWDCSAYVSAGYAVLTGRDPYARWFTTESDFNGLGFRTGLGPASALNIGVSRGGGGMYSHMAATLAGVPFESSSSGVFYGHSTQGAQDPSLPLKWHLPATAFVPPGSDSGSLGTYSGAQVEKWDAEDELDLDSARIAVLQAQESATETNNDPDKSEADRAQANNKVQQAQLRVEKLEEKKRTAESGGIVIPDAPDMDSSYTDDELRLRDLERAVEEAKWDRNEVYANPDLGQWARGEADDKYQRALNALRDEQQAQYAALAPEAPELQGRMTDEQMQIADLEDAVEEARIERNRVYADPRSTQRDRDRADRDYMRALNALDEGKKGDGSTFSASSVAELFGNVAKAAVQGQVEDMFEVIGFGGDGALSQAFLLGVEEISKQVATVGPQSPPSFSADELAKQGPVVPGSPNWIEELTKTLRVPALLRDVGGPLPHGMAGLNLSGETEWVQTAADRRRFDRDMEELAALRAERNSPTAGAGQLGQIAGQLQALVDRPPVQHTSKYYGYEQSEASRRERDRVDQYSRTYFRR